MVLPLSPPHRGNLDLVLAASDIDHGVMMMRDVVDVDVSQRFLVGGHGFEVAWHENHRRFTE